jgi:hypothetical protein
MQLAFSKFMHPIILGNINPCKSNEDQIFKDESIL